MSPTRLGSGRRPARTLRERIGLAIRQRRQLAELSVEDLAERAGFSAEYLAKVEGGRGNATLELLECVSQVLKWDVGEALRMPTPSQVEGVRLLLRMQLAHITEAVNLILTRLEPLAAKFSGSPTTSVDTQNRPLIDTSKPAIH